MLRESKLAIFSHDSGSTNLSESDFCSPKIYGVHCKRAATPANSVAIHVMHYKTHAQDSSRLQRSYTFSAALTAQPCRPCRPCPTLSRWSQDVSCTSNPGWRSTGLRDGVPQDTITHGLRDGPPAAVVARVALWVAMGVWEPWGVKSKTDCVLFVLGFHLKFFECFLK